MIPGYEAFFGLVERPFSLTADPKYFFKSRSHGRAIDALTFGLRRRERCLIVTGEVGVGKTVLCHALVGRLRRRGPVSFVPHPLITPGGLFRLLLEDFGAASSVDLQRVQDGGGTPHDLRELLVEFLATPQTGPVVVIIDQAHTMPGMLVEQLLSLGPPEPEREGVLQLILVGQPAVGESGALGVRALDERASTKTRLLALGRDECSGYVAHRLRIAGGAPVSFTPRAVDALYGLSGGLPRIVNLLCERALQEAEAMGAHKIQPEMIDAAASALELLRARPRRFRWFSKRVS